MKGKSLFSLQTLKAIDHFKTRKKHTVYLNGWIEQMNL